MLAARFAALRVRVADGPTRRVHDPGARRPPGEEVRLLGERRSTGEKRHRPTNLPVDTSLKRLAAAVKARRVREQAHQQPEGELGLDHFEGRSRTGLHRHALMAMMALRLPAASARHPPQPGPPAVRHAILVALGRPPPTRCPHCDRPLAPAPP